MLRPMQCISEIILEFINYEQEEVFGSDFGLSLFDLMYSPCIQRIPPFNKKIVEKGKK